ncbi:MAG: hypothetical protein KAJ42_11735 [Gemmatimonadetes bacterium]|nr:hypothetical protein [Gemmatimonadota bacterium]
MSETAVEETMSDQQEEAPHRAASRRQRLQAIERFFSPVVVKNGSRQKSSIDTIRERARLLAMAIEEHVPEGDQKDHAVQHCAEAMFWSNQAISHR